MPLALAGATSGSTTLQATDAVTATLTLPSSTGTLLSTANPQSGGVIQVVSASITASQSTSSTSYVDVTGLTASITPKFSTSKILIQVSMNDVGVNGNMIGFFNLLRGSTTVVNNTSGGTAQTNAAWGSAGATNTAIDTRLTQALCLTYLDSPATTSSTTYKVQFRVNAGTLYVNQWGVDANAGGVSTITLLEIAA